MNILIIEDNHGLAKMNHKKHYKTEMKKDDVTKPEMAPTKK